MVILHISYHVLLDIIHGKLDQRNGRLEVDFAIGRDAQVKDIGRIIQTLNDWCEACDNMLSGILNMFDFSATY